MPYRVVVTFETFMNDTLRCDHSNERILTEQYFPVMPFITLCKVALNFYHESADTIKF